MKKFLNLNPSAESWRVYPTDKTPTIGNEVGRIYPAQFGGLTYSILGNPQTDVYTIPTDSFGVVNIYAPNGDPDCSFSSSPVYPNGNLSTGGGSSSSGSGGSGYFPDVWTGDSSCNVLPRSAWGANDVIQSGMSGLRTTPYKYIIIHHSGAAQLNSDTEQMRSIQSYHQSIDWGDIGYNFGIGKNGTVMQGRETKYVGAHTRADKIPNAGNSRNEDSIGVCLFGNFNNSLPGAAQLAPLPALLASLCRNFNISPDNIRGHMDFTYTDCPGYAFYNQLGNLKEQTKKLLNSTPSSNPSKPNVLSKFKAGDILVTDSTSFAGAAGHAGIVLPDGKNVCHIAGAGYTPKTLSTSDWLDKYHSTKIVRHKNSSIAYKAAKWALDNYVNGQYTDVNYCIIPTLYDFKTTYCSKLVWQCYYYGADVAFKIVDSSPQGDRTIYTIPAIFPPYSFINPTYAKYNDLEIVDYLNL